MSYLKPQNDWNVNQWLTYLEQRSPQQKIALGLDRVRHVARILNVLNPNYKIITVAGTNGKGSTVRALETIYNNAGYNVGSYTSPHLFRFNERIKVNLHSISDTALCDAFFTIESHRADIMLTYFEMATLAALVYFQQQSLDIVIFEVGLGGRLDATNIMDTDVAVITTIDFDHQEFLGITLEEIAQEKAGIIRAHKPVIYADINPPQSILTVAQQLNAPTYLYGRDFDFKEHEITWDFSANAIFLGELSRPSIQLHSAAAALMVCSLLQNDLPLNDKCKKESMSRIFIAGRLQMHQLKEQHLSVLFDVSHNPQATQLLAKYIQTFIKNNSLLPRDFIGGSSELIALTDPAVNSWEVGGGAELVGTEASDAGLPGNKAGSPLKEEIFEKVFKAGFKPQIHAVFSAMKDKDILQIMQLLNNSVDFWYLAALDYPRAASVDYLLALGEKAGIMAKICYTSPSIAFTEALNHAKPGDLIVVFGSFFTVSDVLTRHDEFLAKRDII